jgi:thioredoxin reductase (NADPH)
MKNYDLIVVGGGPAGMSAAITAQSEGIGTLLIEGESNGCGGQAGESTAIENYLGFPEGLTGVELTERAVEQARKFGAEFLAPTRVVGVAPSDGKILVTTDDGTIIPTRNVILALGVSYRNLEAEGVSRLIGRGVKYGSPTVGDSYEKTCVVVVGGANSSGQAVVYLAKQPNCDVHMVIRNDTMSANMSAYLIERINATPNIKVHYRTQVKEAYGKKKLEGVVLTSPEGDHKVDANRMFITIGGTAKTEWLAGSNVARDPKGYICTGNDIPTGYWKPVRPPFFMETSIPGVFAAGDVRHSSIKRVASAVAEGAIAVQNIHGYLALK